MTCPHCGGGVGPSGNCCYITCAHKRIAKLEAELEEDGVWPWDDEHRRLINAATAARTMMLSAEAERDQLKALIDRKDAVAQKRDAQEDALVAERDQLKAEVERLRGAILANAPKPEGGEGKQVGGHPPFTAPADWRQVPCPDGKPGCLVAHWETGGEGEGT